MLKKILADATIVVLHNLKSFIIIAYKMILSSGFKNLKLKSDKIVYTVKKSTLISL